jgi:RecB family exonuclease
VSNATTLAQLRAERHLSVSAITTFLRCPAQHHHRYTLHTEPSHKSGALAFGSAVHVALARYYRALMLQQPAALYEIEAAFTDALASEQAGPIPLLLDDEDSPEALEAKGLDLLRVFYDHADPPRRVLEVEAPFSIEVNAPTTGKALGARLVGVFDLVVADASGRNTIVEHKTAARRNPATYDNSLQLSAYHLAAKMMGLGDARLTVQVLLKSKKPAVELYHPTRTEADHRDLIATAAGVMKAIDAGVNYPVRDWHCRSCSYAHACVTG